jgi:hypothetical protein
VHASIQSATGTSGSSQLTLLRFLLLYVTHANPLQSLAAAWPKLLVVVRIALPGPGCTPPLLLLTVWKWAQRLASLPEAARPFAQPRERREASELCEQLLRATAQTLARACRRGGSGGGGGGGTSRAGPGGVVARREEGAALPSLGPHSDVWAADGEDVGVVALLALEACMAPLLDLLFASHSAKRAEHAVRLVSSLMPTLVAPLEQRLSVEAGRGAFGGSQGDDRLAQGSLHAVLQVIGINGATKAWRQQVGRLFALPSFFAGLTRRTLPLWARAINAWLCLETPKAMVAQLLSGRMGKTVGWFASRAQEAEALADTLQRLSFALWVGEHNQYVGALQGMVIDKVVAGFKFGVGSDRGDSVSWVTRVQALLCMRVLAVRISSEHLTSLWPLAMSELQRVLMAPHSTRPALLLAACQLVDTVLTVLPDDFSPFGWMFLPEGSAADDDTSGSDAELGPSSAAAMAPSDEPSLLPSPQQAQPFQARRPADADDVYAPLSSGYLASFSADIASSTSGDIRPQKAPPPQFAALLDPLARIHGSLGGPKVPARRCGLLRPSIDGRRRPLLGMRSLQHASDLAPFACELRPHLAASSVLPRSAEIDMELLEVLIGCEFVSPREAEAMLSPHWRADDEGDVSRDVSEWGGSDQAAASAFPFGTPRATDRDTKMSRCTPHESL